MRRRERLATAALLTVVVTACSRPMLLTEHAEAQRVASDLHVQFTKAADASNRAVMITGDAAAKAAAAEAVEASAAVSAGVKQLETLLQSLGYSAELSALQAFSTHFAEYQALDREILPLSVENTNYKAEQLSFGPASVQAAAVRQAIAAMAGRAPAGQEAAAGTAAAAGNAAVLEVQVIQARHIAASDDAAMTTMEADITRLEAVAADSVQRLASIAGPGAAALATAARAELERFNATNDEIVSLSRRNSNVRSLALALGRKRTVTAECDDQLEALQQALAGHQFGAR